MYFWNIKELKARLIEKPFSDREALPYLLLYLVPASVSQIFPMENMNFWDYLNEVKFCILVLLGTLYAYRCNGGGQGSHFLARYFALGWVVGIRWGVVFIAVGLPSLLFFDFSEATTWHVVLFFAAAEIIYFERLGRHFRDVARGNSFSKVESNQ